MHNRYMRGRASLRHAMDNDGITVTEETPFRKHSVFLPKRCLYYKGVFFTQVLQYLVSMLSLKISLVNKQLQLSVGMLSLKNFDKQYDYLKQSY